MSTSSNETMVSVIVDDFDSAFVFDSSTWKGVNETTFLSFDNAYMYTRHTTTGSLNTVELTFEGTSFGLYGTTPPAKAGNSTFKVSITTGDNTIFSYNVHDYGDPTQPVYGNWFQSQVLPQDTHKVKIENTRVGASIDYAVVTKSQANLTSGETIIIDEGHPSVQYSGGGWVNSSQPFENSNYTAYGNTTHRTNKAGDSVLYNIAGASAVNFYGFIDENAFGNLSLSLNVDGNSQVAVWDIFNGLNQTQDLTPFANVHLFSTPPNLSLGSHSLRIDIMECSGNQNFVLDYITYTVPAEPHTKNRHSGAIAGGVVGGVVLVVLCFIFLRLVQRRRRERSDFQPTFSHTSNLQINPIAIPSQEAVIEKDGPVV